MTPILLFLMNRKFSDLTLPEKSAGAAAPASLTFGVIVFSRIASTMVC